MRKRPPFVEFFRDRHGKLRAYYFRKDRRLPRIPLAECHRLAGVQPRLSGRARRSAV